VNKVEYII